MRGVLDIAHGGTSADSAEQALANLGAASKAETDRLNDSYASLMSMEAADLDNPPRSFFFQTNISASGFPTGIGGNRVLVLQCLPGNPSYTAQLAFGFGNDKIAIRRRVGGSPWTEWKYFTVS